MKHMKRISIRRADAFTDFWNSIWRAWQSYNYDKNREINLL